MSDYAHNLRRLRPSRSVDEVRAQLDALVADVDRPALRAGDPVELVHRYADPHDQEVVGLLVAGLAYGRVASIREKATAALQALGAAPARAIEDEAALGRLSGFVYRFQRGEDLPHFLRALGRVRARYGSLAACFAHVREEDDRDHAATAARWVAELRAEMPDPPSYGLRYLLPDPGTGGASKRLLLYLRWMMRGPDGLDLGAWNALAPGLDAAGLVMPLDTHISRISRYLGFTRRAANDLRTAREITARLAELDPSDPVRYDMALCHLGISGRCPRDLDLDKCATCPIGQVCRVTKKRVPLRRRGART